MAGVTDSAEARRPVRLGGQRVLTLLCFMLFAAFGLICLGMLRVGGWFVRPDGTVYPADFAVYWLAGTRILAGEPLLPYDRARIAELFQALTREAGTGSVAWFYPPHALFVVAPFGLLPILPAWFAWTAASLSAFALSLRAVLGRLGVALALGLPTGFSCVLVGQNGFITAALMAGTLHLLDRRPWAAGLLLGLLTYKPHFGPLFPLVLLATWRWRPAVAAAATALALATAAEIAFGPGAWAAFLHTTQNQTLSMVGAGAWDWRKLQSAYGMTNALGGPAWLGAVLQAVLALLAATLVVQVWRGGTTAAVRAAALAAGTLLISPYVFMYDAPVMAVAIAFLLRDALDRGFLPGERSMLVLAALAPAAQFATGAMTLPGAAGLLLWLAVRRSARLPAARPAAA